MERTRLYIDGEWCDAGGTRTFDVINPANGRPLVEMASASAEDVDRAVAAAQNALHGEWSTMGGFQRRRLMLALAREMQADAVALGEISTDDMGMPLAFTTPSVGIAVDQMEYFAGWADKVSGDIVQSPNPSTHNYTIRHPVGVVAAIVPWNAPVVLTINKLAPALAAGCTVVLKPSEHAPLAPLRIAECADRAGLPPGVLNVVTGVGADVGAALVSHPGVDKVSFTGGTEVGRMIGQQAAAGFKRCSLELGGKSANIVFPDADLDVAAATSGVAVLMNSGQQCIAGSRLLVHEDIYDTFLQKVQDFCKIFAVGDPRAATSQMGPVISQEHLDRVLNFVDKAADAGEVRLGGERLGGDLSDGYYVGPTLVSNVSTDSELWNEEVFGPVIAARPFTTTGEAIEMANDSRFGLAGGIWTNNLNTAHTVAGAIRTGTIWVNSYLAVSPAAPFGGFKESGTGREGGWAAIEDYTEQTTVSIALTPDH